MEIDAAREVRTTCPYCGVGCGVLATVAADGAVSVARRPRPSGQFRPALLQGLGAGRDARPRRPAAPSRDRRPPRRLGRGARPRRRDASRETIAEHGPDCGRLLRLRPVADRGLLRRQQADEGLHRLGQHRHQFAPLHGLVGGRPPPRLRRRHGARHLRGPGAGRPRRAGRLQPRLVPSRCSTSASRRPGEAAGDEGRAHRSAPHRDRRHRRPASGDRAGRRRRAVQRAARLSRRARRARPRLRRGAHDRLRAGARRGVGARPCRRRRGDGPRARTSSAASTSCSPRPRKTVTVYSPGRQPVGVGHRQGQRHHQLPSRDRPHRQARRGAVLGHRPAQRHGRPRGRRPGQHARRPHGDRESRRIASACSASGTRRPSPRSPA